MRDDQWEQLNKRLDKIEAHAKDKDTGLTGLIIWFMFFVFVLNGCKFCTH